MAPIYSRRVLDVPFHLDRLYSSCQLLDRTTLSGPAPPEADFCSFVQEFVRAMQSVPLASVDSGLLTMCAGRDAAGAWRLSALYSSVDKLALLNGLTYSPSQQLCVDVVNYSRSTPAAKAASWPLERQPLEQRRNRDAAETVLWHDGQLLEGLTSNLLVMRGAGLQTAPRGAVLGGSMAFLVRQVASGLGLQTAEQAPLLGACSQYDAAFLCSATKPLVPIGRLLGENGETLRVFPERLPDALLSLLTILRLGLHDCREMLPDRSMWYNVGAFSGSSDDCIQELMRECQKLA